MEAHAKKQNLEWSSEHQFEAAVHQAGLEQAAPRKRWNIEKVGRWLAQAAQGLDRELYIILAGKMVKRLGPENEEWEEVNPPQKINGGL